MLVIVVGVYTLEWPWSYVSTVPGFVTAFLGYWITALLVCWIVDAFFGISLPSHFQTVRDLTKAVLAKNFANLSGEITSFDRTEVWESVRILIADQLDVEIEKVTKDASFVADLGMS